MRLNEVGLLLQISVAVNGYRMPVLECREERTVLHARWKNGSRYTLVGTLGGTSGGREVRSSDQYTSIALDHGAGST